MKIDKTIYSFLLALMLLVGLLHVSTTGYGQKDKDPNSTSPRCFPLSQVPGNLFPNGTAPTLIRGSQVILESAQPGMLGSAYGILAACPCENDPDAIRPAQFQWYESWDNGASWRIILNATEAYYTPPFGGSGMISDNRPSTVLYKRFAGCIQKLTGGSISMATGSNIVSVVMVRPLEGGSIRSLLTPIGSHETPGMIESTEAATGGHEIRYEWELRSGSGSWAAIPGATGASYQPDATTGTTTYRRVAYSHLSGTYDDDTPVVTLPGKLPSVGGKLMNEVIQNPDLPKLPIKIINFVFAPPQTLKAYSNEVVIGVGTSDPGSIHTESQVLVGPGTVSIRGTAPASGSIGTYSYQWQHRPVAGAWADISGATAADYTTYVITSTTQLRRLARSGAQEVATDAITIQVKASVSIQQQSLSGDRNYIATYTPQEPSSDVSEIADHSLRGLEAVYHDGLGRPIQAVQAYASPWKEDMVTPITYDALGRKAKDYLPFTTSVSNGSYKTGILGDNGMHQSWYESRYPGEGAYALGSRTYEASPLNRVLEEFFPGKGAYAIPGGATVRRAYSCNGENEVVLRKADGSHAAYYKAGTLYKEEATDPDGRYSSRYTDLQGRLIEERQLGGTVAVATSYAYDNHGRLRLVIPPNAQAEASGSTAFNALVYRYRYDSRGNCIEKKLPDSEPSYYVYDRADRLILSQDGNQRSKSPKEWTFTKYDKLGREIISGYLTDDRPRDMVAEGYRNIVVAEEKSLSDSYGYTWLTPPYVSAVPPSQVQAVSHYDSYQSLIDEIGRGAPDRAPKFSYQEHPDYPQKYDNPKGLLTGRRIKRLDIGVEYQEAIYYDHHRRPIQVRNVSETDGVTVTHTAYSFTGQPVKSLATHQLASGSMETAEQYTYTYDHAGRLTQLQHGVNAEPTLLVAYAYDELGRQQQKTLGANVETISSSYDVQGRLTALQGRYFSQQLHYHSSSVAGSLPQYGGNISATQWRQAGDPQQAYAYRYDGVGRLTSGVHSGGNSESQTYDPNGNLLSITRTGAMPDDFTMTYLGNRLGRVNGTLPYAYDANGNTTEDGLRGMSFSYNRLNLPRQVSKGSDVLAYGYSSDGQKREKSYNGATTQHYRGAMVYDGSGQPEYLLVPEGMVRRMPDGRWLRQYNLTDHLGNVRAVVEPNGTVIQQTDYYPFGLAFSLANSQKNRYLYGSKELQDEVVGGERLNLYDFGARSLDSRIPRFTSIDPLAEKYFNASPYVYCANNPINAIDPDGKLVVFINGMHFGDGGTRDYWDKNGAGFATAVMKHLKDYNAHYYDGSMGGAKKTYDTFMHSKVFGPQQQKNTNAKDRYNNGYGVGKAQARWILEGLNPGETIKIISHSMGAAYAKGFVQALIDSGVDPSLLLFEADFAPYQPTKQKANSEVKTYQFSHSKDRIAGQDKMEGAEYMDTSSDKKQNHGIATFINQINNLPEGKYRFKNGQLVPY